MNTLIDFAQEFPEHKEKIHQLKTADAHFSKLLTSYHDVNRQIHRIEQEIETVSDAVCEDLKKKRLKLKDDLMSMLHKAA